MSGRPQNPFTPYSLKSLSRIEVNYIYSRGNADMKRGTARADSLTFTLLSNPVTQAFQDQEDPCLQQEHAQWARRRSKCTSKGAL